MKTVIRTAVILTVALLTSAQLGAQGTNVTGEWAFTVTTDQGGGNPDHYVQAGRREADRQV